MLTYEDIFANKHRVLFVTAHPDDLEAFWGGLVARLNRDGKQTFVLLVTNGARGSRENEISEEKLAQMRIQEQQEALKILGTPLENFACLNHLDGEVENTYSLIGEISKYIRKWKPEIVVTHDPQTLYSPRPENPQLHWVNHRDHRLTGLSTVDAVFPFSRDRSFFPQHAQENLEPHSVYELLLASPTPNTQIEYTPLLETKRQALAAHTSQFDETVIKRILDSDRKGERYFDTGSYIKLAW